MTMLVFSLPNSLVMGGSSFTHYFQMWVVMLHINEQQIIVSRVRENYNTIHTMCNTQEVLVNGRCCMRRCVLCCLISTSNCLCTFMTSLHPNKFLRQIFVLASSLTPGEYQQNSFFTSSSFLNKPSFCSGNFLETHLTLS